MIDWWLPHSISDTVALQINTLNLIWTLIPALLTCYANFQHPFVVIFPHFICKVNNLPYICWHMGTMPSTVWCLSIKHSHPGFKSTNSPDSDSSLTLHHQSPLLWCSTPFPDQVLLVSFPTILSPKFHFWDR